MYNVNIIDTQRSIVESLLGILRFPCFVQGIHGVVPGVHRTGLNIPNFFSILPDSPVG